MKKTIVLLMSLMLILPADSFAHNDPGISAYSSLGTTLAPVATTLSPMGDLKVVIYEAKDDAALFLATAGQQRGVKLQRALELIRKTDPHLTSSDMQLAESIVAQ